MTERERYDQNLYMWGWDACLKGCKRENFGGGLAGQGFDDCAAGKPLPYWYKEWSKYKTRCEKKRARFAA